MYKLKNALMELEELGMLISVKLYTPDKNRKKGKVRTDLAEPGGELVPEEDGCVAQGREQKNFALIVRMPKVFYLEAFTVQGKEAKEIELLSDFSEKNDEEVVYVKLVPTYGVWHGKSFSTKPHDNNVRVVSIKDGIFKKFEISIVTRIYEKGTYYFLAVQKTYQAQLFEGEDEKVVVLENEFPGYKNWLALQELVENMLYDETTEIMFLDPVPFEVDDADIQIEEVPLEENEGIVIFFNPRLGYGQVQTQKGAKHFSWEKVIDDLRFQWFEKDERITFKSIEENAKGEQLIGVRSKEVM